MSLASKGGGKNGKHGPNDRGPNVGKAVSQVRDFVVCVIVENDSLFLTVIFVIREEFQQGPLLL